MIVTIQWSLFHRNYIVKELCCFKCFSHSLLAARMLSEVRDVMSVDIPMTQLFKYNTVADLSALIDQKSGNNRRARCVKADFPLFYYPIDIRIYHARFTSFLRFILKPISRHQVTV